MTFYCIHPIHSLSIRFRWCLWSQTNHVLVSSINRNQYRCYQPVQAYGTVLITPWWLLCRSIAPPQVTPHINEFTTFSRSESFNNTLSTSPYDYCHFQFVLFYGPCETDEQSPPSLSHNYRKFSVLTYNTLPPIEWARNFLMVPLQTIFSDKPIARSRILSHKMYEPESNGLTQFKH